MKDECSDSRFLFEEKMFSRATLSLSIHAVRSAGRYSPAEFRNRVSMSLQRWASSGEDVLSAWLAVPAQLEAPIHCQLKICRRDNYSMTV